MISILRNRRVPRFHQEFGILIKNVFILMGRPCRILTFSMFVSLLTALSPNTAAWGKTVEYDLVIESRAVNFTGKGARGITINGGIPGPTLHFKEGDIVIEPGKSVHRPDRDHVILLSDWTDEDPHEVTRTLNRGSEIYAMQKGSGQSILGAARLGMLGDYFKRELQRMPPMDIADVAYDRFLANGRPESNLPAEPNETVRLRIIDGSATTYFHLEFAGGPMTIVSADGQDVEPVKETRFLIVWFLNKKPLSESDSILIREGEIARFIMINRTMMHHPMHLHGHFFRVINGPGDHAPLKHTVDVAPMSTTGIEFDANEVGDWFFHCHLLYHMKSGMARVLHYEGFNVNPQLNALRPTLYKDPWYFWGQADILSNMTEGLLTLSNTRNILSLEWEVGWQEVDDTEWEGIFTWDRYINRFFSIFAGANSFGVGSETEETRGVLGLHYLSRVPGWTPTVGPGSWWRKILS